MSRTSTDIDGDAPHLHTSTRHVTLMVDDDRSIKTYRTDSNDTVPWADDLWLGNLTYPIGRPQGIEVRFRDLGYGNIFISSKALGHPMVKASKSTGVSLLGGPPVEFKKKERVLLARVDIDLAALDHRSRCQDVEVLAPSLAAVSEFHDVVLSDLVAKAKDKRGGLPTDQLSKSLLNLWRQEWAKSLKEKKRIRLILTQEAMGDAVAWDDRYAYKAYAIREFILFRTAQIVFREKDGSERILLDKRFPANVESAEGKLTIAVTKEDVTEFLDKLRELHREYKKSTWAGAFPIFDTRDMGKKEYGRLVAELKKIADDPAALGYQIGWVPREGDSDRPLWSTLKVALLEQELVDKKRKK